MCEKNTNCYSTCQNQSPSIYISIKIMIDGTLALHGGCHGDKTSLPTHMNDLPYFGMNEAWFFFFFFFLAKILISIIQPCTHQTDTIIHHVHEMHWVSTETCLFSRTSLSTIHCNPNCTQINITLYQAHLKYIFFNPKNKGCLCYKREKCGVIAVLYENHREIDTAQLKGSLWALHKVPGTKCYLSRHWNGMIVIESCE